MQTDIFQMKKFQFIPKMKRKKRSLDDLLQSNKSQKEEWKKIM